MAGLLFVVLLPFVCSFGQAQRLTGGGAYSYSDSTGKRYSGTYGLQDGQVVHTSGDPVAFSDTSLPGVFQSNVENQRLAFNAARKAFDLSSNQAGYFPNFATRLPPFQDFGSISAEFPTFPTFPNFDMNNFPNSAFASSAVGPGYRRQVAAINPANPFSKNVNRVNHYSDNAGGNGGYYSVASKSYSTSSNINGKQYNHRGAESTIDDNGKVTSYKVES